MKQDNSESVPAIGSGADGAGSRQPDLGRRRVIQAAAAALSIPILSRAARAQDKLAGKGEVVAFSFGGSYTQGLRKYVFDPFTRATGITVVDVTADYSEPQVKAMNQAGRVDWDTAFVGAKNYPGMRDDGMFLPIDYNLWDAEALKGTPENARLKDAVVSIVVATVLAYDQRVFGKNGPKTWSDFWNVKAFPGPRGLRATDANYAIEFALLADGVPKASIWPMTDEKIDRAFKKLDQLKPNISKWWTAGGEPPQLIANREYVMSSCYDGRAIAAIRQGTPIQMEWDGAYTNYNYWTVLKGGPNTQNAQKLVAFANRAQIAAGATQGIGYPGANTNQLQYLPPDLLPLLSISPQNWSQVVLEDSAWLAAKRPDGKTNQDHIQERWLAWRAR
jgi:putative spermidine/putrescine transport system substrate-binding protein/mannopine transport system substrate-binding protein